MTIVGHALRISYRRYGDARMGEHITEGEVDVAATSTDLVEAVREALSRMPDDLYGAFKVALGPAIVEDAREGS